MCTKLPKNILEERLRWVLPIVNKQIKIVDAAKVFPGGKRTLERWVANYKKKGIRGLEPKSTSPKLHIALLKEVIKVAKLHPLDLFCQKLNIIHYEYLAEYVKY